jgi:hypothetical protein
VIREGVVKAAADVTDNMNRRARGVFRDTISLRAFRDRQAACEPGGVHRAPDHDSKCVDHLGRPRELELRDFVGRQGAVAHFREVLTRVDPGEIVPARGRRLDDVRGLNHAGLNETRVNQGIFSGGKNVRPDIDVIPGRVDNLQRPDPTVAS